MASTVRKTSNTVSTLVQHAQISNVDGGLIKSVNTAYADIGDILTYTISIKNTGNTTATSIVLSDTIPSGTSFISNSVTLNGNTLTGVNPQSGVNIGSLGQNQASTLTFKVTVNTIPSPNPIPNNSIINYNYTSDPSVPNGESASNLSNTVTTQINHGEISNGSNGLIKSVNKAYSDVNDILTYTIVLKNTGNIPVNNVILTDTIPNNTALVPGSILVNGLSIGTADPQAGINIGTVNSGQIVTVNFNVQVLTLPSPNPIPNQSKVSYAYTVNPGSPNSKSIQNLSNIVTTQVNSANFNGSNKTVNPQYADIGSTVVYTVGIKNTGNVVANNVIFTDTIPNGTNFIPNSVTINGTTSPGSTPQSGVNVGTISPGSITTLTFSVLVISIPNPNPILNQGTIGYNYTVDPNNPNGANGSSSTSQSSNQINSGLLNPANGSILKTVDKAYASIGDTLTFGLKINNTGNATINNLILTDTVANSLSFVNGSIIINGSPQPGGNIQNGITIGSVPPQGTSTVSFKATVNTIPASGQAINNFLASYTYTVDPSKPNGVSKNTLSNNTVTNINDAVIGRGPNSFSKTVDKAYADLGDILNYTIVLSNTGNVPGNNVVVTDILPNGITLVPNSVTLNGNPVSQTTQNGIVVGTLNPNNQAIITFQGTVVTIPSPNPIKNIANVSYTYTKDPSVPNGESVTGSSVPAITQVNHGEIPADGFKKLGDKQIVKRGDIITYTVTIPNSGNVPINKVVFTDPLPSGTSLVPSSVIVNSSIQPSANPQNGIQLGTLQPKTNALIQFKVIVNTIPESGNVVNQGSVSYEYTIDPNQPPKVVNTNSNTSIIPIKDASINNLDGGFIKSVDKEYAQLNDKLTYTFKLTNTGNVTATNIVFTDTLVNSLSFNIGSVIINGTNQSTADPRNGITIASLAPNQTLTLSFNTTIVSIPNDNLIPDFANVNFNFVQDPTKPPTQGSGKSNTVITSVNSTNFTGDNFKKISSPYYATLGDTIDYSFNINNAGNVTAQNVIFTDSIPYGFTFVKDSLYIGGTQIQGKDPTTGISLGTVGINTPITLAFKVLVITIPSPNPAPNKGNLKFVSSVSPNIAPIPGTIDSNVAFNQINTPNLSIKKTSTLDAIAVGDVLNYTLVVKNNGNVTATNVVINDPLAPEVSYIEKSLKVNGTSVPNKDIVSGVNINDVSVNETVTLTFSASIVTLPSSGKVINQANSNYEFIVDPNNTPVEGNTNSNKLTVPVYVAELTLNKTTNTETAILNQVITYTVKITNTGNITASNIIFRDEIPKELEFIPNTFYLNDKKINGIELSKGVNIGNLAPGESAVVKYDVALVKVCCDGTATNSAFASFNYRTSMTSPEKTKEAGPATAKITTTSSTFKELCLDGLLVVPCPKLDIEEINELIADVKITNYHVIKTVRGVSDENRRLTGYKLIINGLLTQTLEYTANDVVQSVHSSYFERKFSTFIILPEDFQVGTGIRITGNVEDVYCSQLNSREIFSNVTLLLDATVLC
ncbi:DUF11 domain-containing protein [Clostridium botulinum]|nr:DUF11 domain-containing protein [Clostridium botulinum]